MSTSHGVEFIEELDEDDQKISLTGNILSLEDGGSVDLSGLAGTEITQNLNYSNGMLGISEGNTLDLSTCEARDVFGNFLGYFLP